MFSRRGLSRVEDDKLHASFRPFGSSRHGGALVKTVPAGHVISAWPKSEELSAWIFWGTGEFENGARSYIFITLKRLREYGIVNCLLNVSTHQLPALPALLCRSLNLSLDTA